ncbi:DNA primase [Fundidesulfovibrio terrae]|uniref:DNA primase n=1 Tax=Fundidesulfovibrio terrae TaxID=2922866 RepID=UPI001FAF7080|nr:DNA primase [Fundidesulfovibrio terrae]
MKNDPRAIQALKSRLNIADVVKRYLALKPAGARLVGLCPFHNEKTGSFSVSPEKGVFYCFGCQASGDVIDFYCRINGLDFREGLEQLAREAGIALAEFKPDPQEDKRRRQRQAAADMHTLARDFFRDCLRGNAGAKARAYLDRRGVTPEMAERFQLGYAPDDFHGLERYLGSKGFKSFDAVAAGLLVQGDDGRVWDRFRGRLMFPIHEVSGKVVAFGGRVMGEGEPKYLNSSDSVVYKKGEHLFGLHQARANLARAGRALITEGYLDVIALHQHGFTEAVGVLGTALTPQQVKRLTGFTRQVTLVFDGDAAGEKAALRSAQMLLSQGAECRVVLLPQGEDADSILKSGGHEAFQGFLDASREGLDFCLSAVRRARSSKEVVDWALEFLDGLDSDGVKAVMLTRLAHGLGVGEHELRSLAATRAKGHSGFRAASPAPSRAKPASIEAKKDAQVLEFAIRCPGYIPELEKVNIFETLATERARAFWRLLARFGQYDVLPYLDERQKSFWGQCASKDPLSEDEARSWWEDITAHAGRVWADGRKRELIEAMRLAREQGDSVEEKRLMAAFSELVGRNQ